MARGRHRHSALHRIWVPLTLGGVAVVCAGAAWLVGAAGDREALVLRVLVAVAALAAVNGAVLLRSWDVRASRLVARERGARAGLTWRVEERQAEVDKARERIAVLEQKLQAKRADLERLRTEHAALLRRYATAETERANALEGRRRLALEAAEPAKALPARATDHRTAGGAPTSLTYLQAYEALGRLSRSVARQREEREAREAAERQAREAEERLRQAAAGQRPVAPPPARTSGFDFFSRTPR